MLAWYRIYGLTRGVMNSSELAEAGLPATEKHERDLSIDEVSIRKAIKDYEFDKLSREEL
jgi:hypothetical protein